MVNDRQITISVGASRRAVNWQPQTLLISELYERLRVPARSTETMAAYLALPKGRQDDLKDVGGFVAGTLNGSRRKAGAVTGRDVLTLDLDSIPAGGAADVVRRVEALGCGYCIYSTRKHMPSAPRLRVLLPLDRTCTADEYEPCARRMAEMIGMELCDSTTFEASRLMYFPSCCADGEYIYYPADKPMLSVDGLLKTYADWHDFTSWPAVPGTPSPARLAAKQGDPLVKHGAVGAFCRVYDIEGAMAAFLPGVYVETDIPGRFTFTGGSTTGGAVLYDDGKFLYSHHATDPCGGRLVNAFDLVRLHRFGDADDTAAPGTPVNRMPSYTAMCELATQDPQVSGLLLRERWEQAADGFAAAEQPSSVPEDTAWMQDLKVHSRTGIPLPTIDNAWIILEHDPRLVGKFALNEFAGRGEVLGSLPWDPRGERRAWEDNDNQGVYWFMEKMYGISGAGKIDGALSLHSNQHAFNDVKTYLDGLKWDGVPRLDTLLVDYLGAEDTPYVRAVTRKMFAAAVARALLPGTKFDNMLILGGPQGIGKSTLIATMSCGWFNDSIRTFEGKDASELLQGVWLVEIAELQAFRRTDIDRIKQFVSQQHDRFRAAYGRHVKELPRRCVFFGTTNTSEYLRDKTGNRRFWPVDAGVQRPVKSVWVDLPKERGQLWAEAVAYWRAGEPLYLSADLEDAAKAVQEEHREHSVQEGLIRDFLDQPVPVGWSTWDLQRRRMYWDGNVAGKQEFLPRDRVCALEIWCEALGNDPRFIKNTDAAEINAVVSMLPGWQRMTKTAKFGYCKTQRGFERKKG